MPQDHRPIIAMLEADRAAFDRLGVAALWVFGSAARGEAGPDSDVDVLVRFACAPTFDRYMDLKCHLEEVLGRTVDLVTEKALRPEMRAAVEREAIRVA